MKTLESLGCWSSQSWGQRGAEAHGCCPASRATVIAHIVSHGKINFWIKVFPEWVLFPLHCEVENCKSNHHKSGTDCIQWTWRQRSRLFLIILKHSSPQPAGEAALQCRYHGSSQVSSTLAMQSCLPHREPSPVALSTGEIAKPEGKPEGNSWGLGAQDSCFGASKKQEAEC